MLFVFLLLLRGFWCSCFGFALGVLVIADFKNSRTLTNIRNRARRSGGSTWRWRYESVFANEHESLFRPHAYSDESRFHRKSTRTSHNSIITLFTTSQYATPTFAGASHYFSMHFPARVTISNHVIQCFRLDHESQCLPLVF